MRSRGAALVTVVSVVSLVVGGVAAAADTAVSATVSSVTGARVLTVSPAVVLAATGQINVLSAKVDYTVVESGASGSNWYVTSRLNPADPFLTDPLTGKKIAASNLSLSATTLGTLLDAGNTVVAAGTGGTLSGEVTVMSATQTSGSVYLGTYPASATLSLTFPSGTATGSYAGTMVSILYQ